MVASSLWTLCHPQAICERVPPVPPPDQPVREAVRAYAALQPGLVAPTEHFVELITTLLDDAGINYLSVTGRTKSVASFAAKAARATDGQLLYADPLNEITDQIGIRVITYVHSDVAAVAELLDDELTILDDRDMGQETASAGGFGYASRHLLVTPTRPTTSRICRRTTNCAATGRACRCARCCSTRGPSSSTTSATRAPCPRSTSPTSTGASPWPPDCSSSPTASSPPSANDSRPLRRASPGDADPSDPRISGQDLAIVPRRAVRRRGLVAHRPLRLDRRASCSSSASPRSTSSPGCSPRSTRDAHHPEDGLPLPGGRRTPPRRRPARHLRPAVRRPERQRHRVGKLTARLEKLNSPDG